ncbi:MAG: hypothetical protein RI909_1917 [Bacteroidota bacterium]
MTKLNKTNDTLIVIVSALLIMLASGTVALGSIEPKGSEIQWLDTDGDGLDDTEEATLGTNPNDSDSDDDGLNDGDEVNTYATDALNTDTDADGLNDGDEINLYGTDPTLKDSDGDKLNDGDEISQYGSDPTLRDTDGDQLSDGEEVNSYGSDPTITDSDTDGLSDGDEINLYGSDPTLKDTDNDKLNDGDDITKFGSDPTLKDTDGDKLNDGDEITRYGSDPTLKDTDGDKLDDGDEITRYGCDPTLKDTDTDGLSDGDEVNRYGTDPTLKDSDSDGMSDGDEILKYGTDPLNPDSDNDDINDNDEVILYGSDPLKFDSDGDGCNDGKEILQSTDVLMADQKSPEVSNSVFCQLTTAALTAKASNGYALIWYGTSETGGIASSTAPIPSTSVVGTTDYFVSQKNTLSGCESPRAKIVVTINETPAVPVVSPIAYCQAVTATALTATGVVSNTLLWYGTDATGGIGSAVAPTPVTTAVGNADYYVSQKNTVTGCESSRAKLTVTIKALPAKPIITATGLETENMVLSSSLATGNQWFKNNTEIPGANAQTYTISENGLYTVKATIDGCVGPLSEAYAIIITNVLNKEHVVKVSVYPNPAHQELRIAIAGVSEEEISEMVVFDSSGKLVTRQTMKGAGGSLTIDQYPQGNYLIRITNKSFLLNTRFAKH